MMVGRLLSYWEGNFSGSMLIFRGVPRVTSPLSKKKYQKWEKDTLLGINIFPIPKALLKMILLLQWWDMLVSLEGIHIHKGHVNINHPKKGHKESPGA